MLVVAFFAVLLPLCLLTHHCVEVPSQTWGRRLARRVQSLVSVRDAHRLCDATADAWMSDRGSGVSTGWPGPIVIGAWHSA